jgi:C4-dicarboxylate-binding protein DctP
MFASATYPRLAVYAIVGVLAAVMCPPCSAQDMIKLRLSNQLPPSAAISKGLESWKALVETGTKGRVIVELYHSSQLYKDTEITAAVQRASVDMGLVVAGQFVAYDPHFSVFDLPGLFRSYDQAVKTLSGDLGRDLGARLDKLGVVPMFWAQQGFAEIATNKRPLLSPADFKGLKLRVHSRELARMSQLLGAAPTTISAAEVSTALTQGTVDGLSTSLSSYEARKWYEGAPFVTSSKFGLVVMVIVANKRVWSKLPADVKDVMSSASEATAASINAEVVKVERDTFERLRKVGVKVTEFDAAAQADFLAKTQPMYEEFYQAAGEGGRKVVSYIRSLQ